MTNASAQPERPTPPTIAPDSIPAELRKAKRWLLWNYGLVRKKWTKVPHVPGNHERRASSTDPSTWSTFDRAFGSYEDGKSDGVGFVLGDGWSGVDLDFEAVNAAGALTPRAKKIVESLSSYTERSPSGSKLHVLTHGELPAGGRKKGTIEMYSDGRFFTVTGHHIEGTPTTVEERTAALASFHALVFGTNGIGRARRKHVATTSDLDDTILIERARSAKNGAKFTALWSGDASAYPSPSEADMALCHMLAFWTGCDANRMDTLFRQSGLVRDKWYERHYGNGLTYGEGTIDGAIKNCSETYKPSHNVAASIENNGNDRRNKWQGPRTVTLTPASSIQIRPVHWLWKDRVALGTFNLLGGREGIGKSICSYTISAMVTRGELPGDRFGTPKSVLVAATEDSWEHTIVPRLMAAGANLDRVFRVDVVTGEGVETALSLPRDLKQLEAQIFEADAGLIVLDPLLSRLDAALDSHKDAEVRMALEPLVALANKTNTCVIGLIHVNKSSSSDALSALMGSRAFVAVARAVLFVMADPDDESKRLLGQPKNNLGRSELPTLLFRIDGKLVAKTSEGDVWTGKLQWLGETERTIQEALEVLAESQGDKSATAEAADWLQDLLETRGGSCKSKIIKREGRRAGHNDQALRRARKRLKLTVKGEGFPRETDWTLPRPVVSLSGEPPTTDATDATVCGETH